MTGLIIYNTVLIVMPMITISMIVYFITIKIKERL